MTIPTMHNPMLEDDEELTAGHNPMLEDDEATRVPVPHIFPAARAVGGRSLQHEPKFGEPGFGAGKPKPHRGSPRAKVTEVDAPYLAFLNEVQVADATTLSTIGRTRETRVSSGGRLPSPSGTNDRMKRLAKMGLVESVRSIDDRSTELWGITEGGIATSQRFGYTLEDDQVNFKSIKTFARKTQNHYRAVAMVAANFLAGAYEEKLGIGKVALDQLVSEPRMRRQQAGIKAELRAKNPANPNFGGWRQAQIRKALAEVKAGDLYPDEILDAYPALWTIGQPTTGLDTDLYKDEHWADLVIDLDQGRRSMKSSSILVEVELTKKNDKELVPILRTLAKELEFPIFYKQIVYFTHSAAIAKRIARVDRQQKLGLIEGGKLKVLTIEDRYGKPFSPINTLGGD
jgi:hypothetical protein